MRKKLTGFRKVAVIEMGGKDYYYALYDDNINAGDSVMVSGNFQFLGLIPKVKEVMVAEKVPNKFSGNIISEVICKVDTMAYEKRIEKRVRAEKLKKEMDKKIKEMQEVSKYEMYAERNPELAKMLEEYNELI